MPLTPDDIVFVFSGGPLNVDPYRSLGGGLSNTPVPIASNNLFPDITKVEALDGFEDFRCVYAYNGSIDAALFNAALYARPVDNAVTQTRLGFRFVQGVQEIILSSAPSGGILSLTFEDQPLDVAYPGTTLLMAQSIAASMNVIMPEAAATGSASIRGGTVVLTITTASGRYFEPIALVNNGLSGVSQVSLTTVVTGGPINQVTPPVAAQRAMPNDMTWYEADDAGTAVPLGTLLPGDWIPIWVRRTTASSTQALPGDGFDFVMVGETVVEPSES